MLTPLLILALLQDSTPKASPREITLHGTVVPLAQVLADQKIVADAPPIEKQFVLKGDDGTITPLLSNGAGKALFLDDRLRDRPTEITGWLHPGLPYLEPVALRVEEQGQLRTPEYYCDVCTITVRYPQDCPCCQGAMELRFKPAP